MSSGSAGGVPVIEADIDVTVGDRRVTVGLRVASGEVVAVLGPNGAGKTTLARALAGLQPIDSGRIVLDGRVVDEPTTRTFVPASARGVGVVFQDLRLFPHLTAADNVAFGLSASRRGWDEAAGRAGEWLARVGLAGRGDDRPAQLSGGEAQRVALARALAPAPRLLLLDEPMAALDVEVRGAIRRDLSRLLPELGTATLLVTHDPLDAVMLATRVVVVEAGRVVQEGTVSELTSHPRTRYVAELVGTNLLRGVADGLVVQVTPPTASGAPVTVTLAEPLDGEVLVVIPPSAVALHSEPPAGSPRNRWPATVTGVELVGGRARVRLGGPITLIAEVTADAVRELGLVDGAPVWAAVKATEITAFSA